MENIKKSTLIEYLINEMDELEPLLYIYKYYYNSFCLILNIQIKPNDLLTYSQIKTEFINLLNKTSSYYIIIFMKTFRFYGPISLLEESLNRKLTSYEYKYPIFINK